MSREAFVCDTPKSSGLKPQPPDCQVLFRGELLIQPHHSLHLGSQSDTPAVAPSGPGGWDPEED